MTLQQCLLEWDVLNYPVSHVSHVAQGLIEGLNEAKPEADFLHDGGESGLGLFC